MRSSCLVVVATVLFLGGQVSGQPPSPTIDHHQHLFSPSSAALAPGLSQVDVDALVKLLDIAGIQRAAVLSVAYQFGNPNRPPINNEYEMVRDENDWTSQQVGRFPTRLVGFCGMNPLKGYALAELARCASDPNLRAGIKLHFGNSDVDLDNPEDVARLRAVFAAANSRRMAVVVHLRPSVTRKRPYGAQQARVFLDQVLTAAPDVTVQIAHLAGAGSYDDPAVDEALAVFVEAVARGDKRMANVYFDISGVTGLGKWADKVTLVATRIRQLGVGRILYGSDGAAAPNLRPREASLAFRRLPLSEAEFRTIETNVAPYMR